MPNYHAEDLIKQGETLRESDKPLEAIAHFDNALKIFKESNDWANFVHALQQRSLSWKHLWQLSGDKAGLENFKSDAEQALAIAKEKSIAEMMYIAYFNLAQANMEFKEYSVAVENYEKSLEDFRGSRPERGDYIYHLGEAMYRAGNKEEGQKKILEGLGEIEKYKDDLDSFYINIWISGAHMRLGELLWTDEPEEARSHLNQAKEIITKDERLVIRKKQLAKLEQKLGRDESRR